MARPRKPTAVHELSGAFIKNPARKRARANEPKSNGDIGDPPSYFDAAHKAIWREYIDECPPGVLAKADRKLLEVAVRITRKQRLAPGKMNRWMLLLCNALTKLGMPENDVEDMRDSIKAALSVSTQELSLLITCLGRMGMSPADRSKVSGSPDGDEKENPWDSFGSVQ